MPHLSIPQLGLEVEAEPGANLLQLLRRHQVPIRYSCKRGECGSCKCRLERGQVEMSGYQDAALPAAQRAQGLILACCSTLQGDIQLGLVDSDDYIAHPERQLQTRVIGLRQLAPELFGLRLAIVQADADAQPFTFSAGQYAELTVVGADGQPETRAFSMASTPVEAEYDGQLEFHIRRTPTGAFSSLLGRGIQVDSTVALRGPMGSAYFRPRHPGPLLAVAAGTGLAPMLSVVETALSNGQPGPVRLWAGFRNPDEVYGRDRLAAIQREFPDFDYRIVVERDAPAGEQSGLVGDAVLAEFDRYPGAKVYLAGSPSMVESVSAALLKRGVASADLHADAFYAPPATPV